MAQSYVWIFNGTKGKFPGGIFSRLDDAEQWICANELTGVLTRYPLDMGSFDWAKAEGLVSEKLKSQANSEFIASFSSASFEHFHYEDGVKQ